MSENEPDRHYGMSPSANIDEAGYLKFSPPLQEREFQHSLIELKLQAERIFGLLDRIEENPTFFKTIEECIVSFVEMMRLFEESTRHPNDVERIMADKDLVADVSSLLDDFKRLNLIEVFRHGFNPDEAGPVITARRLALADIVQKSIHRLEFYVGLIDKQTNHE